MLKILQIGLKDVTLAFRDRAALILMLAAPFALTLGLGFVTGRFNPANPGSSGGLSDIPVVVVNTDGGQLGDALVNTLSGSDLDALLNTTVADTPDAARQAVDADQAAAAVIIPPGFTDSILPSGPSTPTGQAVKLEVYANPTRPTSAGVVEAIIDEFVSRVEAGRVSGQVAVTQLLASGRIQLQDAPAAGQALGQHQADAEPLISLTRTSAAPGSEPVQFDILAYLAPGMALMFLMYTVSNGGRTLLTERAQGTLARLLVSPTASVQVLGGKVLGIYLTGVAQMTILIGASTLLFGLHWGNPWGVAALVLAAVAGATGWGLLLTAFAKSPAQVNSLGSALMLMFGILSGAFVSLNALPEWVHTISRITPNAWGLEAFTTLAAGGSLADIAQPLLALGIMAAVLFAAAAVLFNRQGIVQR